MFSIFDKLKKSNSAAPLSGKVEYLIVGLGNPGPKYENTRHNVGFLTINALTKEYDIKTDKLKFKSMIGDAMISGKRCLLMQPVTFMNNSGEAIAEAMRFYKIPIENVIVIYDDISLEPGFLRIRDVYKRQIPTLPVSSCIKDSQTIRPTYSVFNAVYFKTLSTFLLSTSTAKGYFSSDCPLSFVTVT